MRDPFAVMGLPHTATPEEIKARYRQLAREHHPDAGHTGSSQRMAEINRAHDELRRDLEGCRRRAVKARQARGPQSSRGQAAEPRKPPGRAEQWKDWFDRARRATSADNGRAPRRTTGTTANLKVSPSILTICRHHGPAELKVVGKEARSSSVLFSSRHFDVVRGSAGDNNQLFRVRLTSDLAPGNGESYLRVRSRGATRRVPVYEFSCPSAEGSCAFAS